MRNVEIGGESEREWKRKEAERERDGRGKGNTFRTGAYLFMHAVSLRILL